MNDIYTVLIVEDDAKQAQVLSQILEKLKLRVFSASNGAEALAIINTNHISLILLDISMPIMDGFQFAQHIRNLHDNTPIIFVSANSDIESQVKGLQLGALDYIIKPINFSILKEKVKNWLTYIPKNSIEVPDNFMARLKHAIESNIENASVVLLANSLHCSESSLLRKVKSHTNKTVSQYIREYRLKKAHQLILGNSSYSIAEVATKVGYHPAQFSKAYKEFFGYSPKETPSQD